MFDTVRNNPKLVQIFLVLITLPFAFWGIDSYMHGGTAGATEVATVGKSKITQQQFQQAMQMQTQRLQQSLGPQFDPAMMNSPEARMAVLGNLINQRLLTLYAADEHIDVSDAQLAQTIASVPALQVNGKFSVERFEEIAQAQGLTKQGLEARVRQDMTTRMAVLPVVGASLVSHAGGDAWLAAVLQARDVSQMQIKPDDFIGKVTLDANAAKTFYDNNQSLFEVPEQVRFEYVVLSQKDFAQKAQVSDADIKAWYDSHKDRYTQPEERRASHILISVDKNATPEAVKAAKAKAESILAQVKKNPADFAKLAKAYSQDAGSASKGGDLGVMARDGDPAMKPFVDALYSLKQGEVSGLVRTDYGFHIIRLTGLKPAQVQPLSAVKAAIAADLKTQAAAKKYAEAADNFTNMVYEQPDSLKPEVDQFGLQVQQGPWVAKGHPVPGLNEKIVNALFSDDAIKNKRNTDAVEIAPNTLMAARVVDHKAAVTLPFAQVQAEIEKRLKREEAVRLAAKDAAARLAKLNAGDASAATFGPVRTIVRVSAQGITGAALRAVFETNTAKLPAYAMASSSDGSTTLFRISKVTPYVPSTKDDAKATALRQQYDQTVSEADFDAWMANLRSQYKITINQQALAPKSSDE